MTSEIFDSLDTARNRPLAIVTGASSGIGYHLALRAATHGFDLVIAADTPTEAAAAELRALGARVDEVQADLATRAGVDRLLQAVGGRRVSALMANAGHGLGHGFLDQDFKDIQHVIDTNITGTTYLIHSVARAMRSAGEGRVLITGSIAGFQPGAFQAVYNGTKAFVDSFAAALRNELKDSGVSVSCLMPGATATGFFERAGMMDTKIANDTSNMDPAEVARIGFDAMLEGEADVVAGFKNKVQAAMSKALPSGMVAEQHRKMAEPGTADA